MNILQKIGKLLSLGFLPIKRNASFCVFMYVLGIICTYCTLHPKWKPYEMAWEELYFDIYVLALFLTLLPLKLRRWVRGVFYVVAYTVAIVDLYCFVKFDSTLNPTMLLLVGETNSSEASEFLASYLSLDILGSCVGLALLLLLVHILVSVFRKRIVAALKQLWAKLRVSLQGKLVAAKAFVLKNMPVAKSAGSALLGAVAAVLFVVFGTMCWQNKMLYARLLSYKNIGDVEHELTKKPRAEQYQPVYRLAFSIYANKLTANQLVKLKSSLKKVSVDSCSFRSNNIVLIIGESYNRNHSQLYGYKTPNTPRQKRLYRKGELIKFTDVVSPWNLTSFVFKHLFSLYTVGDKGEWCDYPLFPELFRKAGYHVTFMTNQFLPQAKEAVYDFSGGFFLNDEELSKAQFDTRNTQLFRFDNGLLCDYEKQKNEGEGKPKLTIFHLKGQHVDYKSRCPSVQKKFDKGYYAEKRPELSDKQRQILADYDNAILYNDSIVTAIIDKFRKQDAIILYVPDHGEECYDDAFFYGRMHSAEVTARLAHAEFEIPMWIWASKKYKASHRDIWQKIRQCSKRPYMTDALPHLLLWLAGIESKDYRDALNILSDDYNAARPRILKQQADYDKLMAAEKAKKEAEKAKMEQEKKGKKAKNARKPFGKK